VRLNQGDGKQRVCFAVPTITGDIRCEMAKNLIEAVLACHAVGIETDLLILANCPVLPVARNTLVAMFMDDKDATDLFFLDYDVGFDPIAVVKVLQRPEEIIAGAYRVKVDDRTEFSVVPKLKDGAIAGKVISEEPPLAVIEADFLATGFMRIKREVFERMAEAYPNLKYNESVIKTLNRKIEEAYDFFGMGIDDTRGRYTTEDYMFCKRWRDIGGQLWIYPDINFDHIGRKAYSGNFHEFLLTK
jgi:hypothetical protein